MNVNDSSNFFIIKNQTNLSNLFISILPGIYYPPGNCVYASTTYYTLITGKVTSTTTVLVLVCVVHTHNVYNVQQCYCVTVLCILPGTTYYLLHVVLATGVHTLECARVLRTTYNYVCAHHTLCFVCAHTCVPRTTCVCAHTCVYHTHLTYIHT